MRLVGKNLLKDDLFRNSSIIFIGSMVANIINYLFQITMGRMLSVQTFGEMNALLSAMIIFSVPFASITNYIAKNVSHLYTLGKNKKANDLIMKSYKYLFIVGFFIVIIGSLFSRDISTYLKIKSIIPILLLFLSILISIIIPINTGVLQGFQKFKVLSFIPSGTGIFRYLVCIGLVVLGLGLNGVMIGNLLSLLLLGYISFLPIIRHFKIGREKIKGCETDPLSFVVPIFLANLSFAIFSQSDVVLVKYFFDPHDAGIYSSAAIIGKAVMYLPGAVVISLFPMVVSSKARDEETLHLILKSLAISFLLSGSGAIIIYLFPEEIISIFFGMRFASAVSLIGLFAIAMLPMAIMMIIMNYNIAKSGRYFAYVMLLCAVIQTVGILIFHDSLVSVLKVILYSGLLCTIMLFLLLAGEYLKSGKSIKWKVNKVIKLYEDKKI